MKIVFDEEVTDWDDSCVICGDPFFRNWTFQIDCGRKECIDTLARLDAETGQCAWCGRSGKFGAICVRRSPDGNMEECGTFG